MRKVFTILLALTLILCLGSSAFADITMYQYKVEIQEQLTAYAAQYSKEHGYTVNVETLGGGGDYIAQLKAKNASGEMPDIFVIEGPSGYNLWKEYIEDLSDQPWVDLTTLAFQQDGKVYGFPASVEGFGLAYNPEILAKAGVDPTTMNTFEGIKAAFETIDAKKEELGLDGVVSMCCSVATGMTWVTGTHNFTLYTSSNVPPTDRTYIDQVLQGKVDEARLKDYADYVKLLFDYTDKQLLLNGNYDDQIAAFAEGRAAFLHQGNWVDPSLETYNITFKPGFMPHAFLKGVETTGLIGGPPQYLVVNSQSPNKEQAKEFLNSMVMTEEGQDYMVNQAKLIPAFTNIKLVPSTPLSQDLYKYVQNNAIYLWHHGDMPDGFSSDVLGPIYELFAQGQIDEDGFIKMLTEAIASIPTYGK